MNRILILSFCVVCLDTFGQVSIDTKIDTIGIDSTYKVTKEVVYYDKSLHIEDVTYVTTYYLSWSLKENYTIVNGGISGLYRKYYEDGNIMEEYSNVRGRRIGLYLSYYPNGKLLACGRYKDIQCYDDITYHYDTTLLVSPDFTENIIKIVSYPMDIKLGKWVYYNDAGTVLKIENY